MSSLDIDWLAQAAYIRQPVTGRTYDGGRFQIYQHGHALAIYWPKRDQHAWFFNAETLVDGDFKFDHWNSVESVSLKEGLIRIKLAERLGPDKKIKLRLLVSILHIQAVELSR